MNTPIGKNEKQNQDQLALQQTPAKYEQGKPDLSNYPIGAMHRACSIVRTANEKKYPDPNGWQRCTVRQLTSALMRHLESYTEGEIYDKEDGLSHLAHAAWNLGIILELIDKGLDSIDSFASK
jgi:hypothetical protein